MTVGVHAGEVARLVHIAAELRMDGAGVAVLMLLGKIGDHLAHDVEQIMLQVFQIERVDIVRALLDHDGAGGVVRRDADCAVLDAGLLDDLNDLAGDIVEGGDPAAGLQLEFFLINLEFHCVDLQINLLYIILYVFHPKPCARRRSSHRPWPRGRQPWQRRRKNRSRQRLR